MRKEGYCAFGAARTSEALQTLLTQMSVIGGQHIPEVENALAAAHRLQTCLTLFRTCYPKKRVAAWKRRLRRVIRALNKARTLLRTIEWVQGLDPSHEYRIGVKRALLRLVQRADAQQDKVQQVWQQWLESRSSNEILGLSRRWVESFAEEPCDLRYAEQQWMLFAREQLSALEEGTGQPLEVRLGRLRALIEGCELIQPLLECHPEPEWLECHEVLDRLSWQEGSKQTLQKLLGLEAVLTLWFVGHLRRFGQVRKGWEWLIQQLSDSVEQTP